ncbi:MAG: hypothetical protein OK454_08875 [Thaumarchaeota archaeon]|nr:hypothetical protein [Nitrososphaerota archaeon]
MSSQVNAFKSRLQDLRKRAEADQKQQLVKLALELGRNIEVQNIKKIMSDCAAFYLDSTYLIEDRVMVFDMMIQGEFVVLFEGKTDPEASETLYYWGVLMHKFWYGMAALQLKAARLRGNRDDPTKLPLGREEIMAERFAHKYIFPNGRFILTKAFGVTLSTSQFTVMLQQMMPMQPQMPGDRRLGGGNESDLFAEDQAQA